jgi:Putative secretion activating protein
MRQSFGVAFQIVIGLEGKSTNDPNDPGGLTVYGLSKRYNPTIHLDMTLQEAKDIYLYKYWMPAGCDDAPFPLDICLFDGQVNPQNDPDLLLAGNKELLHLNPENWQEFLILRMLRYSKCSKEIYREGHLNRVLRLFTKIKELPNGK